MHFSFIKITEHFDLSKCKKGVAVAKVVILGAGLTGLSIAYHLEQNSFLDFAIFEKESTAGGLLRSFKQDDFTFDFTGHFLHISDQYFHNFLDKIVGFKNLNLTNRNSAIYSNNIFTPYPFQMNLAGLPTNVIFDCVYEFVNRKNKIKTPRSFYDWVLKYFGKGLGQHFFFPYNSKLLSYDLKKITPSWTGRFVPQTDLKTILWGALNKQKKSDIGYNGAFYYPKKDGIQLLIDKLATKIKTKIKTKYNAKKIDLKNKTVFFENGKKEKFEKLITTLPLNNFLQSTTEKTNSSFKKAANKLLCNSVINFNLGFDKANLTDKHWCYFPEKKYSFYRIGFWHNICQKSAKKGCSAIYGEVSYLPKTKTDKQLKSLTNKAITQSLKALGLKKSNIVTEKILQIPSAYVIYNFWREKYLKQLHKELNNLSIYSVGRYGEWKYSSMQEAVLDGKKIAEQICK